MPIHKCPHCDAELKTKANGPSIIHYGECAQCEKTVYHVPGNKPNKGKLSLYQSFRAKWGIDNQ